MVRIKGANSDYVYTGNPEQPIQENKDADPLYLKIFICPNDMPSRVEKPHTNGWCEGTDQDCPDQSSHKKSGHAMICLDEKEGISFVTQNQIIAKGKFTVENGQQKSIEVTDKTITVSLGGTIIKITEAEIQISNPNNQPIQITGNLAITGNVKVTGKVDLSQADVTLSPTTIQKIKQS